MAWLHHHSLTSLMVLALLLPPEAVGFAPASFSTPGTTSRVLAHGTPTDGKRLGPQPLLLSSKPDVKDTSSVITEMEGWARVVTFGTHISRDTKYVVSEGTDLPQVLFDFWKAVSDAIDEHRATSDDRPFRKLLMFVAPYCEELRDFETMERTHQLLKQSARDVGCNDFGKAITHTHYHPHFRHRPKPKRPRIASRHSPHPAFSIDVYYRRGGRKSLASTSVSTETPTHGGREKLRSSPVRLRAGASPEEIKGEHARRKKKEWAAKTRTSLEHAYRMAASYGREDAHSSMRAHQHQHQHHHALAGRGVPESSQEIMQDTQEWLKDVLKDAALSDAAEAATEAAAVAAGNAKKASPPSTAATVTTTITARPLSSSPAAVLSAKDGGALFSHVGGVGSFRGHLDGERSTAFKPPSAAEAMAAADAAAMQEEQEASMASAAAKMARAMRSVTAAQTPRDGVDHAEQSSTQPRHHTPIGSFRAASTMALGLRQAFVHAAELVIVQRGGGGGGGEVAAAVAVSSGGSSGGGGGGGGAPAVKSQQQPQQQAPGLEGESRKDEESLNEAKVLIGRQGVGQQHAAAAVAAAARTDSAVGGGGHPENVAPPLPGKELVKRMENVSQYIVARSKTAEEAYSDVWEVIAEMADRAASRGCAVPAEDCSLSSMPCYGALLVTPDLATYSSGTFFRFQETINKGLKHLPMEHNISVEAFHPEAVSEVTPLDHPFTRSPFPTLHICYHGLRADGSTSAAAAAAPREIPSTRGGAESGSGGGGSGES